MNNHIGRYDQYRVIVNPTLDGEKTALTVTDAWGAGSATVILSPKQVKKLVKLLKNQIKEENK